MSGDKKSAVRSLAVHGGILAITSLLVRLIGFFYRIPMFNKLGAEGVGYYNGAYQIYAYILVISSYGLPSALAKIVSQKHAQKRYREAHDVFKSALVLGLLIGLITSAGMYFGAGLLAKLIKQEGSFHSFQALAPSLFMFSVLAVFRGYFQGHNTMVPTAVSQIVEQVFNAAFSLLFVTWWMGESVAMGAAGGTLGTAFGIGAGLVVVVAIYWVARPTFNRRVARDRASTERYSLLKGWRVIYGTALPILIGASVYNLSNLIDALLFQRGLQSHGHDAVWAAEMYGTMGSYMLLLTLPISIASALAAASIPSITASVAKKEEDVVRRKATLAFKTVLIVSIPAAFGLAMMAGPILHMIYRSGDLPLMGRLMGIGAMSVVFFSISGIITGILQGLGKLYVPIRNALVGILFKVVAYGLFIYVLDTGIYGAVIINVIFGAVVALLNLIALQKHLRLKWAFWQDLGAPIVASLLMGIMAVITFTVLMSITGHLTLATLVGITVGGVSYVFLLIGFGGVDEEGLRALPLGHKIVKLSKKLGKH